MGFGFASTSTLTSTFATSGGSGTAISAGAEVTSSGPAGLNFGPGSIPTATVVGTGVSATTAITAGVVLGAASLNTTTGGVPAALGVPGALTGVGTVGAVCASRNLGPEFTARTVIAAVAEMIDANLAFARLGDEFLRVFSIILILCCS
jgi:hypothetical protein